MTGYLRIDHMHHDVNVRDRLRQITRQVPYPASVRCEGAYRAYQWVHVPNVVDVDDVMLMCCFLKSTVRCSIQAAVGGSRQR